MWKSNDTSHFEVQILGLVSPGYKSAPKAGDAHLSPGWGTNISHATRHLLTLWATTKTWHSHKQIYIKK